MNRKNYQYVLFDWDGCLAKTLQIWLESYKTVFAKYDIYPEDKDITEKVFGDWNGPAKLGIEDVKGFIEQLLKLVHSRTPTVELYEGAKEILANLQSKRKKLAILTTSKRESFMPALDYHDLKDFFNVILSEEDVTKHKPDPEIIESALVRLHGNRNQAVIIGDSKSDLEAAQNAKVDSILFFPEDHNLFYDINSLKSFNPTYIIDDLCRLDELIT